MKHRWELLEPFAPGEQNMKRCKTCGVTVRTAYGGYCYLRAPGQKWDQSNSPHMRPCPYGVRQ